jgi:hypothetical protein
MYRVYVLQQRGKGRGSAVLTDTRTATPTATAAHAAFWALHGADYDHTHLLLITRDNKQVAAYRYGSRPGEPDYIPPGATLPE